MYYYLISFLHCFLPCYEISLPTYYNMDWSKETHVIGLSGTLSDGWEEECWQGYSLWKCESAILLRKVN